MSLTQSRTLRILVWAALLSLGFPLAAPVAQQKDFPEPPSVLTRVYYLDVDNLVALPFESGILAFDIFQPAVANTITRVRVSGPKTQTVLKNQNLRFFVFVGDRMDPPPHQLVRLTSNKTERSLKISLIKGRKGYAPFAEDNVPLERRILRRMKVSAGVNRFLFVNYLELRPRAPLRAGEYAIIGDSLADMATFRVEKSN
jgi:hypothetical protein